MVSLLDLALLGGSILEVLQLDQSSYVLLCCIFISSCVSGKNLVTLKLV